MTIIKKVAKNTTTYWALDGHDNNLGSLKVTSFPDIKNFNWMLIHDLSVYPEFRRQGVATELIKYAADHVALKGKGSYAFMQSLYDTTDEAGSLSSVYSLKAFLKAGFELVGKKKIGNKLYGLVALSFDSGDYERLINMSYV